MTTTVQKCKRALDTLESRDTSAMGYQAKLRHQERIAELKQQLDAAMEREALGGELAATT